MSTFCALARFDGGPVDLAEIDVMLDALDYWRADRRGVWCGAHAALGHLLLQTQADPSLESLPATSRGGTVTLTGDLRLDNRAALADALDIAPPARSQLSDGALVIAAYEKWGTRFPTHLRGDFALALWDEAQQHLVCARDPFGVRPLCYAHHGAAIAVASEIKGVLPLPFVDRRIDEVWVADLLHRLFLDATRTLFRGIRQLAPATVLVADHRGLRTERYWSPDTVHDTSYPREEDAIAAFRDQLWVAIRSRLSTSGSVGAELSGGLDSSGVAAMAQRVLAERGQPLYTFSQVRPDVLPDAPLPEDARAQIDAVCAFAGIRHNCRLTGADGSLTDPLDDVGRFFDQPPPNVISLNNDDLYDAAAATGVRVLLSGFGGNQCVSSALAAGSGVGRLLRWLAPGRLWVDALLRRGPEWQKFALRASRDDFAARMGMWKRTLQANRQHGWAVSSRQALAQALARPTVALRFESAHVSTAARRMEYRYPLLDQDLIATYLALPAHLHAVPDRPRYVFRMSLAGVVPDEVRWDQGPRASASPGSAWRKHRDAGIFSRRLAALPADDPVFQYVDRAKLDATLPARGEIPRHWRRETEIRTVLLLSRVLRDAARLP